MEYGLLGIAAVLIIVAVARVAPKVGVATPIVLVVVGVAASYLPGAPELAVDPELILMVILPPILYSAAVNMPATDFRRNFKAITGLSVLLVAVSAVLTGLLLHWLVPGLSLAAAIALGAVISPPDAVAAISIGKRLGLPPRLVTVLEGEGLINDATALVLLRSAIAATAAAVSFAEVIGDFAYAVAVGLVVGLLVGIASIWVRAKLREPVLNTAISFTVPFLAFVPAEELHASGVLAVVVAGLVTGHLSPRHLTAEDRVTERTNWRTVALLLDNGVFLLMGFEITAVVGDVRDADASVGATVTVGLIAVVALIVIRAAFVVPLVAVLRREQRRASQRAPYLQGLVDRLADSTEPRHGSLTRLLRRRHADAAYLTAEGLDWHGAVVLAWSGMRGVVTLAAAQSLPADFPYRSQLVLIAFTVAVTTLLVQGTTLPLVIRKLGVSGVDAEADRRELRRLVGEIVDAVRDSLDSPELRRSDGHAFDPEVLADGRQKYADVAEALTQALAESSDGDVATPHEQRRELRRIALQAGQAALVDARQSGTYSSRALLRAQTILDAELARLSDAQSGH